MLTKLKRRQAFSNDHLTNLISSVEVIQSFKIAREKISAPNISKYIVYGSIPDEHYRKRSTKGPLLNNLSHLEKSGC